MVTVRNSRRYPHSFDQGTTYLGDEPCLLETFGIDVDDGLKERLRRNIHWVLNWEADQPRHLYEPFVRVIQRISRTSEGTVGEYVTVTSLPRVAVPTRPGIDLWIELPPNDVFKREEMSWTYGRECNPLIADQYPPGRFGGDEQPTIGGARGFTGTTEPLGPLEGMQQPSNNPD